MVSVNYSAARGHHRSKNGSWIAMRNDWVYLEKGEEYDQFELPDIHFLDGFFPSY
jgi:hypothetical protein